MNQGPYQPYNNQQPPYPPPYQQPTYPGQFQPLINRQHPRGFRQWLRTRKRGTKFMLGGGSLFAVLFLCICSLAAYGSTLPTPKAPTPITSVANNHGDKPTSISQIKTIQPTPTLSPTPTPIPTTTPRPTPTPILTISSKSAILGGAINAFDKKFGANNCCDRNGWTPPNGPYVAAWDDSYSTLGFDETSPKRVIRILIQPQSTSTGTSIDGAQIWDGPTANQICNGYLPPDAVFQSGYQVFLANALIGYTKVYSSALLAHTIPGRDFTDKGGNLGKPGTIYVYFGYHPDANQIDHCTLGIRGKDDLEY